MSDFEHDERAEPVHTAEQIDPVVYAPRSKTAVEVIADEFTRFWAEEGTWQQPADFGTRLVAELREQGFELYAKYAPVTPGATLYAYRFTAEQLREFESRPRINSCPNSGWVHAGGGPPWRVIISEDRRQLDNLRIPGATVEVYDGDEATLLFDDWMPRRSRS